MRKNVKVKSHKRKTKNGVITIKGFLRKALGALEPHSPVVKKREAYEEMMAEKVAAKAKEKRLNKQKLGRGSFSVMNSSNQVVSKHESKQGIKLKPGQYIVDNSKTSSNNGRKWKRV